MRGDRAVWPSATTRVAGVIGSPVGHSLSPVLHNAAFRALDLNWVYVAFEVQQGGAPAAVEAMRVLGIDGLSVTMPHKQGVLGSLDRLSPAAARLDAANTVHRVGTELVGDNTDGAGFVDALRYDEGVELNGLRCVVVGAGGAARAVALAMADEGADEIAVINRTAARGDELVRLVGGRARAGAADDVRAADVIVNATPVGMVHIDGTAEPLPIDANVLHEGQIVVDLVYHPPVTPLLTAAREKGAVAVNGLGMLIHQAAHQFRLWTGYDAPLEAMSAAALAAVTHRAR